MFMFKPSGLQIYEKETPTQVFSCEICDTFKNTFSDKTPPVAASERTLFPLKQN